MKCAMCGYPRIEEHGTEPGDYNWFFCPGCGRSWPTEKQERKDEAKREQVRSEENNH